ncbi:right-handed parallel beta-helix repeat-containing protein [Bacillus sp. DJP31]|uniref:right-handed parallel beta-helix repeat-containing protein n=1 Tax=Bacillus sp. DJP31 TaxID=3409789 RepID=UPI003BB6B56F
MIIKNITRGKRKRKMIFLFIVVVLILIGLTVLGYTKLGKNSNSDLLSITVDSKKIDLRSKEKRLIFVTTQYKNGDKKNVNDMSHFSSSDINVVTVDSAGVVTGKKNGTAKITVRYRGIRESITISVTNDYLQLSVKDFGAYGDGLHDDTSSFQNAIDYLAEQGGGDLFIPAGTYDLHPIFLKSKVNLVGENRDRVILKLNDHASNEQTRLITMESNTKVQSLTCDGNYQNHPNGSEHMHCVFVYDSDYVVIENNRLINAVGDGISVSGSKQTSNYVVIANNIIEENQRSQIVIEQVNHVRILNNIINSQTGRPGIHFEPWEEIQYYDAKITGNTIDSNTKGYCILLTGADSEGAGVGGSGYFYQGIEFYKNNVTCPFGFIRIVDTSGVRIYDNTVNVKHIHVWRKNEKVSIYNNKITGEDGIRIEGSLKGNLISSNTLIEENTFHTSKKGIVIEEGAENIKVTNNQFFGSGSDKGIQLFASEDILNVDVKRNTFSEYETGVYFDYDSYVDRKISDVTVMENKFSNIDGFSTFIMGPVQQVVIDKNSMNDSSGVFIYVHEGRPMSNISIRNNVISRGKRGIYLTEIGNGSLKGLQITGNYISSTTDRGDGNITGAAIELDREANLIKGVLIRDNTLIKNNRNFITVPDALQKFVSNNNY